MKWFEKSNRNLHFKYGITCGLMGTILFALGVAVGMELKDKLWGGKWDWLDILSTVLGGLTGQAIQIILIMSVILLFR